MRPVSASHRSSGLHSMTSFSPPTPPPRSSHFSYMHPIDRFHFYSVETDLTRPFPSSCAVDDYDSSFVWNASLRTAFACAGLSCLCPPLLCGCIQSFVPDTASQAPSSSTSPSSSLPPPQLALAVITRKLSTHPGTRFEARGVDSQGDAGKYLMVT
jgi:hypothetical protein